MKSIEINTGKHSEVLDITRDIQATIPYAFHGLCIVSTPHTTAGLTLNENADPDVKTDIISCLDKLIPWNNIAYKHAEGNSSAHVKASMMGFSVMLPVVNGRLHLGTWQGVMFCEFDGPRCRKVNITLIDSKF